MKEEKTFAAICLSLYDGEASVESVMLFPSREKAEEWVKADSEETLDSVIADYVAEEEDAADEIEEEVFLADACVGVAIEDLYGRNGEFVYQWMIAAVTEAKN